MSIADLVERVRAYTPTGPVDVIQRAYDFSASVHKGIEFLIETQRADGSWDEELSTGTGFPRVFYLQYHLYRQSFPVLALATYRKTRGAH